MSKIKKVMGTKELVKALRTESRYKDKATLEIMDYCMAAAETIETLEARVEQLAARDNPQPLTLDELRQMDGQPVWVVFDDNYAPLVPIKIPPCWMIVSSDAEELHVKYEYVEFSDIGWTAYRYHQKEVQ